VRAERQKSLLGVHIRVLTRASCNRRVKSLGLIRHNCRDRRAACEAVADGAPLQFESFPFLEHFPVILTHNRHV
jgi:hypothetical protein